MHRSNSGTFLNGGTIDTYRMIGKKKYKKGNPWTIKTELMTIYLDVLCCTLCTGEKGSTIKNTNERIRTISTRHVQDTTKLNAYTRQGE